MILGSPRLSHTITILVIALVYTTDAHLKDNIDFSWNDVSLPFPLSDTTSNYMEGENGDEDGFVIIVGGCDSEKGNERLEPTLFACLSTSNATLKFDPFKNTFTKLTPMPHARQRHTAAVINNKLYVIGGRDSNDALVPQIDSYDPKTNEWTTHGYLPEAVLTSDLTAWSWKNYIYVTGGFIADYTAVGTTYRFDPSMFTATTSDDNEDMLMIENYDVLQSSPHPRGDFHAVALDGYAYLAGGITHTSQWCVGLKTTERYHMATDTWENLADLNVGRADMAVAIMNNKILAVGGEEKPPEACSDDGGNDPAYGSIPSSHIDALLLHHDKNDHHQNYSVVSSEWVEVSEFEDGRFRFSAAVVPSLNRMYTFGGQLPFDFNCDCFPTSTHVGVGEEVYTGDKDEAHNNQNTVIDETQTKSFVAAIILGSVIGAGIIVCVIRATYAYYQKSVMKQEEAKLRNNGEAEFQPQEKALQA